MPLVSFNAAAEEGYAVSSVEGASPERVFEHVWAMDVMDRTRRRLAEECAGGGKVEIFDALFPDGGEMAGYAAVGAQLRLSETALRSTVMRLRGRWRELIRAELSRTLSSSEVLNKEMRPLQAAL